MKTTTDIVFVVICACITSFFPSIRQWDMGICFVYEFRFPRRRCQKKSMKNFCDNREIKVENLRKLNWCEKIVEFGIYLWNSICENKIHWLHLKKGEMFENVIVEEKQFLFDFVLSMCYIKYFNVTTRERYSNSFFLIHFVQLTKQLKCRFHHTHLA